MLQHLSTSAVFQWNLLPGLLYETLKVYRLVP